MLDNNSIEKISVDTLDLIIIKTNHLLPEFHQNDKGMFVDGKIRVFGNKKEKKEFKGEIAVQIKGKIIDEQDFDYENFSYPIDTLDLKGYLRANGCIYFVGCMNKEGDIKQYYYKILTPAFLKDIETICNNQKTKSIRMYKLHESLNEIDDLVFNAANEIKRQISLVDKNLLHITEKDKIMKLGNEFIAYYSSFYNKPSMDVLLNEGISLYLKVRDTDVELPVAGEFTIQKLKGKMPGEVYVNGEKYYDCYDVEKNKNVTTFKIGHSLILSVDKSNANKAQHSIKLTNKILDYVSDLKFLIALYKHKKFEVKFNNKILFSATADFNNYNHNIDNSILSLEYYNNIITLFNILHITPVPNYNINNISDYEHKMLDILITTIVKNKRVKLNNFEYTPIVTMKIMDKKILLCVIQYDNNEYSFVEFKSNILRCGTDIVDNKIVNEVTPYIKLTEEDYITIDNLDYDDIYISSTRLMSNDEINAFAVSMIGYYDKSNKKELLYLARRLIDYILSKELSRTAFVYAKLNIIQIDDRINNEISIDDLDYLNTVLYDPVYNDIEFAKIGAALLLKNKEKVNSYIQELSDDKKNTILSQPIYVKYMKQ